MKETEQTLLDQIKEEVAKENGGYKYHRSILNDEFWKIVCERYATAKAKAIVLEKDEIIARMGNEIERLDNLLFENRDKEFTRSQVQASCEATLMRAAKNGDVDTMEDERGRLYILQSSILDPSNIFIL